MDKMNHIFNKETWDEVALINPEGNILTGYTKEKFWDFEVKIEGLNQDTIFLDIGCGIGRIAKWVSPLIKEYYGVDFSTEMIKKAKEIFKDHKNVNFFVNNGIDLEFEDNKFDVVYVFLLFQHMTKENTLNYIKEVYRILKKGGIFFANNIGLAEKYEGGLTNDEIEKAMRPFKILNKEKTKCYYDIKCQK